LKEPRITAVFGKQTVESEFHISSPSARALVNEYIELVRPSAKGQTCMNPITSEKDKLGFIGIGYMGRPIAQRLLEAASS